jgi:hypothetical protein
VEGKVIFEISSTKIFSGTVYGQGNTALILANMGYGNETQWDPFVNAVDKQKFTVITFNYFQTDPESAFEAIGMVFQRVRESGFRRVVCIGASLGVSICGKIAHEPEMIGVAMIAAENYGGTLRDVTYPKLFIAGELDPYAANFKFLYDRAADPKELIIFPGASEHGTDLFYSATYGGQFLDALLNFVNKLP